MNNNNNNVNNNTVLVTTKVVAEKETSSKAQPCPHCHREFTNLRHHINQQHMQVTQRTKSIVGPSCNLHYNVIGEELQVHRMWLQLLSQDRPGETHQQRARQVPVAMSHLR